MFKKPKRTSDRKFLDMCKDQPCIICGKWPTDPAHIKTVKSGGPDHPRNVIPMCRLHHTLQHSKGWIYMIMMFPTLWTILNEKGWEVIDVGYGKKLVNYNVEDDQSLFTELELRINIPH